VKNRLRWVIELTKVPLDDPKFTARINIVANDTIFVAISLEANGDIDRVVV
jgi:hypothetical protein